MFHSLRLSRLMFVLYIYIYIFMHLNSHISARAHSHTLTYSCSADSSYYPKIMKILPPMPMKSFHGNPCYLPLGWKNLVCPHRDAMPTRGVTLMFPAWWRKTIRTVPMELVRVGVHVRVRVCLGPNEIALSSPTHEHVFALWLLNCRGGTMREKFPHSSILHCTMYICILYRHGFGVE